MATITLLCAEISSLIPSRTRAPAACCTAPMQTFPLNPPPQNRQDGTDLDLSSGVAAGQGGGAGGDIGA